MKLIAILVLLAGCGGSVEYSESTAVRSDRISVPCVDPSSPADGCDPTMPLPDPQAPVDPTLPDCIDPTRPGCEGSVDPTIMRDPSVFR